MFLHLSVILFTGARGLPHPPADTPTGQTPPGQTPPCSACWDTVNKWAVRTLLECILVVKYNVQISCQLCQFGLFPNALNPCSKSLCASYLIGIKPEPRLEVLWLNLKQNITRMHSSRMRTARSLIVSPYLVISQAPPPQSNHAHPPGSNHTPPRATMHAPPQSNHTCPPRATMQPPEQPHTPRSNHAHPSQEQPCMPPPEQPHPPRSNHTCPPVATTHAPLPREQPCMPPLWTESHTPVKT